MNKRTIWRTLILAVMLVSLATSAFAATYKTLRYRDSGSAVQQMQQALNKLGYSTGGVDGKFGPTTEKAVRQFQKDNGLQVDGAAGSQTLTLLYAKAEGQTSTTPVTPPSTNTGSSSSGSSGSNIFGGNYNTLKYGSRGDRVKVLQQALNDLGFNAGSADGKFGTGTQRAVVAFQKANGLTADGKAGTMTLKRIEAQLAGDTGGSVVTNPPAAATPAPTQAPSSGYQVPTRTLRKGYQGEDVKSVQRRLKDLGYYTGSIDGKYGSGSMAAVRSFQSKHGLSADGLAGSKTYAILFSANAKPANGSAATPTPTPKPTPAPTPAPDVDTSTGSGYEVPTRTLRKNYEGEDVKSVQRRLRDLGYYKGSIDGKYGSGTMAAVKAFQQKNGLTVDGLAGTNTYRVLYSANAIPAAEATPTPAPTPVPDTNVTLRKGMSGQAVQQLQNTLADLGYTINTNGIYTSDTAAAVKQFQRNNGLTADGVAGVNTLTKLYSGTAVGAKPDAIDTLPPGTGLGVAAPSLSQVQLLYWQHDIKPTLSSRAKFLVYDPATGLSWTLQLLSAGRHADSEPLTATDTAVMFKAFGNQNTWNQKPVYVRLPDGRWTIGSTHNVPHLSGNIKDNNFDGHLCLHLLRDMSEAELNDPKYGVANQETIRAFWKSLTGQEIPYK